MTVAGENARVKARKINFLENSCETQDFTYWDFMKDLEQFLRCRPISRYYVMCVVNIYFVV